MPLHRASPLLCAEQGDVWFLRRFPLAGASHAPKFILLLWVRRLPPGVLAGGAGQAGGAVLVECCSPLTSINPNSKVEQSAENRGF